MKSRLGLAIALVASFLLGLLCVRPVAHAIELAGVINCKANHPCAGGKNAAGGSGVEGTSTKGDGVIGISGPFGTTVAGAGLVGRGTRYGVAAESQKTAAFVFGTSSNPYYPALAVVASAGTYPFYVVDQQDSSTVSIAANGDISTTGKIYTAGSCSTGCSVHAKVRSYVPAEAEPSLEDTGEARLVRGEAYVPLDPKFANAIDPRGGYYVLITPESSTAGLYVAGRAPGGFTVRENLGGRSSGPFAYRIVAHPFGEQAPRLPRVELEKTVATEATR